MSRFHILRLWENCLAVALYFLSVSAIRPEAPAGDIYSQLLRASSTQDNIAYGQLTAFGLLFSSVIHGLFHGRRVWFHFVYCLALSFPSTGALLLTIQYLRSGLAALLFVESMILLLPLAGFDPFASENPFRHDETSEGEALELGGALYSWFKALWVGPIFGGALLHYVYVSWASLSLFITSALLSLAIALLTIALSMWLVSRPRRRR